MATMRSTVSQYVKYEVTEFEYSRDNVTVAAGQNLKTGQVVAKLAANGKIVAYDPTKNDGSQNPVGIMVMDVDATTADKPGVIIARHAVIVDRDNLYWPATPATTNEQREAAIAALKNLGIISRTTA